MRIGLYADNPHGGEVGEQDGDLALGDLVLALSRRRRPNTGCQLRRGQELLDLVEHRTLNVGGGHARDRTSIVSVRDPSRVT